MQRSDKPHEELAKCRAAVEAMRKARSFPEFEEHWREFLRRLDRVWNKTEAHYSRSPKWHSWGGKHKTARTKDELLCYLVQARNVDEHTVEDIAAHEPGAVEFTHGEKGFATFRNIRVDSSGNMTFEATGDPRVVLHPPRPKLLPVTNKGRTYPVPRSHAGTPIDPLNVPAVAELGLKHYEGLVVAAEAYFVK